jgi:hypothetical protein
MGRGGGLFPTIYLIIGLVIAGTHHYLRHLATVRGLGSALLAIVLWPLVLFGVNLHIH